MSRNMEVSKAMPNKHRPWSQINQGSIPWCATFYVTLGEFLSNSMSLWFPTIKREQYLSWKVVVKIKCRKKKLTRSLYKAGSQGTVVTLLHRTTIL